MSGTREKPCKNCEHDREHYTMESENRHDHNVCAWCCEASKFKLISTKKGGR